MKPEKNVGPICDGRAGSGMFLGGGSNPFTASVAAELDVSSTLAVRALRSSLGGLGGFGGGGGPGS